VRAELPTSPSDSPKARPGVLPACLLVFLLAMILYGGSASRGIQWQDSGAYVLRVVRHQPISELGLALSHPLHHWICRGVSSLGVVSPPFAASLVSAFFGAATIAGVFGCVLALTQCRRSAALAAASLMLANTFWQMAALAEVYTITTAFLAGECWCLIALARSSRMRWLVFAALLNGLGVSNHLQSGLTTPILAAIAVYLFFHRRLRLLTAFGVLLAWLLGAGLYGFYVARDLIATGDLSATIHSALFGTRFADNVLNASFSPRLFAVSLGFLLLGFPNLTLVAFVRSFQKDVRNIIPRLARRAMLAGMAIHFLFVARYSVVDQYTFLLPTFVYIAIFSGTGFARFAKPTASRVCRMTLPAAAVLLLITPGWYALIPAVGGRYDFLSGHAHKKPYRDDYEYLFIPWAVVEQSAARMSNAAATLARPDGLVVCEDPMAQFALEYTMQQSGEGIAVIASDGASSTMRRYAAAGKPVVLVPKDRDNPMALTESGSWVRSGDLYVLEIQQASHERPHLSEPGP